MQGVYPVSHWTLCLPSPVSLYFLLAAHHLLQPPPVLRAQLPWGLPQRHLFIRSRPVSQSNRGKPFGERTVNLRSFPCFICGSCLLIPSQRARWGHIRNPSELGSAGVLQARERTVTIPAVRRDTPVLGSSKLLFEVTNGSLQRSNQLCGFYSCPRQLPNCVNGYFGENKERLTQKIQKGKFHCTLIFPFWKRQGSYLSPGGVALGKSDFIPYNNPLYWSPICTGYHAFIQELC